MTSSSVELAKHAKSGHHVRENSEYTRLVISNELRSVETDILQPQAEARTKSFMWWIKAFLWCMVVIIFLFISWKWGVPFIFQKVLLILNFIFWFKFVCTATALIYIFLMLFFGWERPQGSRGGGGREVVTDNTYLCWHSNSANISWGILW